MLGLAPNSIRRHLTPLIEKQWIEERNNPKTRWDRTKQYRVNVLKIQEDLQTLGYALDGYPLFVSANRTSKSDIRISKMDIQNDELDIQNEEMDKQYQRLLTETTTENTSENTSKDLKDMCVATHAVEYSDAFDHFWAIYPRRIEKRKAFKAWNKQLKCGYTEQNMIDAARHYAQMCQQERRDLSVIKHPATFLGPDKPFDEMIDSPIRTSTGGGTSLDAVRRVAERMKNGGGLLDW